MDEGTSPPDPLVGRVLERYRILARISSGGMGTVYLAEHTALRRRVAVKILPPELARDPEYAARFRREALAAARIEHPNVVQVYDVGEYEGRPFLVRQYVEGLTLAEILRQSGRLDFKEAARVAREVARGLAAAHARGVIHRDVKPENILVSENGEIRLFDFGIALAPAAPGEAGRSGLLVGTPHFLSPEQAEGKPGDERSDLYSLGVTLYAAATGRVPFTGPSVAAVLYKHVHEPPRRPSDLLPEIPPFLEGIILRLLEKNPAKRYPSAAEAERDLDLFVRGLHPRGGRPRSPVPRGTRGKKSLPGAVGVAAGAVAVLGALGGALLLRRPAGPRPLPPEPPSPRVRTPVPAPTPPEVAPDETAYQGILEAERTGPADLARQRIESFLRDFPSSPRAPEVRRRLAPPAPAALPEEDFQDLYRTPGDRRQWSHSPGLDRRVFFLDHSILVSIPPAEGDPEDVEFLVLHRRDLQEYLFRFELWVEAGCPEPCVGKLLRGEATVPGRSHTTALRPPDLPPRQWHALELEVRGNHVRLSSGDRVLSEREIGPEGSPYGRPGFLCRPGMTFELRHPRIRILRIHDFSRPGLPPPSPPPAAPPEGLEVLREAVAGAGPGDLPALALQWRARVLSRPPREAYDGRGLDEWRISGTVSREEIRPLPEGIEVSLREGAAFLEHPGFASAPGLSFEIRVRRFRGGRGAGLAFHRLAPDRYRALLVLPGEVLLREAEGGAAARRDFPSTLDRWFRIDALAAGDRTLLFLDGTFLWAGPSPAPPGTLGPAALLARDMEGDFRAIRIYPP